MTPADGVSPLWLKIDGLRASADLLGDLLEVVVDHSLHMPNMVMLRFACHDMKWLEDRAAFPAGRQVEVFYGEAPAAKLVSARIATSEPELEQDNPSLVVRGFDLSHRLYRGRHRRSFVQVSDADLVRQLAVEAGLGLGTIANTPDVHEYVFQNNETNAEFLLGRARRLGFELWMDEKAQLNFCQPRPNGQPVRLAWGDTLSSFRVRVSPVQQLNEVEVRCWNPTRKREITGLARSTSGAGIWGDVRLAVVDQLVQSAAEADRLAQATLDEATAACIVAEGVCDPQPLLVPGRQVKIDGVGKNFAGPYYITRVTHDWSSASRMTTRFIASGRRDTGLLGLLDGATTRSAGLGLVIGIVTNNRDPGGLDRIKVRFPWLCESHESTWARLVSPVTGAGYGFFYLPEIEDEVLVGFEHGDIHRPYIIGGLWNGRDQPPAEGVTSEERQTPTKRCILRSHAGHTITLDDTAGVEALTIEDKSGSKIVFDCRTNAMRIEVVGDLTIKARGEIAISSDKKVAISPSPNSNVSEGELMTDFIGRGWDIDPRLEGGGVALLSGDKKIKQSIEIILRTRIGERVMRPTFGSRLHELVFAPANAETLGLAERHVAEALRFWEPRIDLTEVIAAFDQDEPARQWGLPPVEAKMRKCGVERMGQPRPDMNITVRYSIKVSQDERSLVYPFYRIPKLMSGIKAKGSYHGIAAPKARRSHLPRSGG